MIWLAECAEGGRVMGERLEFRTPRGRMRHACISSWGGILTAGCHVQAADSAGARNCAHLPRCSRCLWIDREPDS